MSHGSDGAAAMPERDFLGSAGIFLQQCLKLIEGREGYTWVYGFNRMLWRIMEKKGWLDLDEEVIFKTLRVLSFKEAREGTEVQFDPEIKMDYFDRNCPQKVHAFAMNVILSGITPYTLCVQGYADGPALTLKLINSASHVLYEKTVEDPCLRVDPTLLTEMWEEDPLPVGRTSEKTLCQYEIQHNWRLWLKDVVAAKAKSASKPASSPGDGHFKLSS